MNESNEEIESVPLIPDTALSEREKLLLAHCERTIEVGLKVFYEVGRALLTIRDLKLYRASHRTFEQYCQERWHFSRQHAYRHIDAWKTYQAIEKSEVAPTGERQLRPLRNLPREQKAEVWEMAISEAKANGAELTHLHVENAVQRLLGVQTQRSKIKKISLRLCVVCGYSFSDEHHVKPQSSGGKRFESITLCPNHHRYATLLQHMLDSDYRREDIDAFAHRHFDSAFNEKLLNKLLDHSYYISSTLAGSFDLWLTQHNRAWEMRKDDDYEREI